MKVHSVQGFESVILSTALFTRAWRWLIAQGASYAAPLPWAKAFVEESPTSWLLPISYDQPPAQAKHQLHNYRRGHARPFHQAGGALLSGGAAPRGRTRFGRF